MGGCGEVTASKSNDMNGSGQMNWFLLKCVIVGGMKIHMSGAPQNTGFRFSEEEVEQIK